MRKAYARASEFQDMERPNSSIGNAMDNHQ